MMSNRSFTLRCLRGAAQQKLEIYQQIRNSTCFNYLLGRKELVKIKYANDDLFRPGNHYLANKLGGLDVNLYKLFKNIGFEFPQVVENSVTKYKNLKRLWQTVRLASSLHANGDVFRLK